MSELQISNPETNYSHSAEYEDYALVSEELTNILSTVKQRLANEQNLAGTSITAVKRHFRESIADTETRLEGESQLHFSDRFETAASTAPRHIGNIIEMAWEINNTATVEPITQISHGYKQDVSILDNEIRAKQVSDYKEKYELDPKDVWLLADMLKLDSAELEALWYKFESVATSVGEVNITRVEARERIKQAKSELKRNELAKQREKIERRAANDALSDANEVRFKTRQVIAKMAPGVFVGDIISGLDNPYETYTQDSATWAVNPLKEFRIDQRGKIKDRRKKEYRDGVTELKQDLMHHRIGSEIYSILSSKDRKLPARLLLNMTYISKVANEILSLDQQPTDSDIRALGARIANDYLSQ